MKLTPKNSTTRVIPYRSTLLCEVTLPAALRKNNPAKTQVPARIAIGSDPAATTEARTSRTQAANPSTPAAARLAHRRLDGRTLYLPRQAARPSGKPAARSN